jgi:hypothetical protein
MANIKIQKTGAVVAAIAKAASQLLILAIGPKDHARTTRVVSLHKHPVCNEANQN